VSEVTAVARRYAEVLLELAQEASLVRGIREELSALAETIEGSAAVREALVNPRVADDEKRRVLRELVPEASDLFRRFLDLLIRKGRLPELTAIARAYEDLADEREGILRARVETVVPLDERERAELKARLGARFRKEILLEERSNPEILGGVRVIVGDEVLDLSLHNRLERLKERLIALGTSGGGV
jgi:F-type H+-transporting ATPase subunit delta